MRYYSSDGSFSVNEESLYLLPIFEENGRKRREIENKRISYFRSINIKAAHPDDGWVDRENNTVILEYPIFQNEISVGDKIVLYENLSYKYRIVEVTEVLSDIYDFRKYVFKPIIKQKKTKTKKEKLQIIFKKIKRKYYRTSYHEKENIYFG